VKAVDAAEPPPVDAAVRDPLDVAMAEKRYSDVVESCSRTVPADKVATCTLAACRTVQEAKAQKWYAKLTSANARKTVATSCREAGVDLVPKVTRPLTPVTKPDAGIDKCAANPMACQR
jgi:hypothetical protein